MSGHQTISILRTLLFCCLLVNEKSVQAVTNEERERLDTLCLVIENDLEDEVKRILEEEMEERETWLDISELASAGISPYDCAMHNGNDTIVNLMNAYVLERDEALKKRQAQLDLDEARVRMQKLSGRVDMASSSSGHHRKPKRSRIVTIKDAQETIESHEDMERGIKLLFEAVCKGVPEEAASLIKQGVDVNAQNSNDKTPLHEAASAQNLPMVELLLASGALTFILDEDDRIAIDYATNRSIERLLAASMLKSMFSILQCNDSEMMGLLINAILKRNDLLNIADEGGNTVLHMAVRQGRVAFIRRLLSNIKTKFINYSSFAQLAHSTECDEVPNIAEIRLLFKTPTQHNLSRSREFARVDY